MKYMEAPKELGLFYQRNTRLQESVNCSLLLPKVELQRQQSHFSEKVHKLGIEITVTSQCKGHKSMQGHCTYEKNSPQ